MFEKVTLVQSCCSSCLRRNKAWPVLSFGIPYCHPWSLFASFSLLGHTNRETLIPISNTLLPHRNHKRKPEMNGQRRRSRGKNGKHTHTNLLKFCQCLMIVFTINRINWLKASVNLSDTNWQRCVCGAMAEWELYSFPDLIYSMRFVVGT